MPSATISKEIQFVKRLALKLCHCFLHSLHNPGISGMDERDLYTHGSDQRPAGSTFRLYNSGPPAPSRAAPSFQSDSHRTVPTEPLPAPEPSLNSYSERSLHSSAPIQDEQSDDRDVCPTLTPRGPGGNLYFF